MSSPVILLMGPTATGKTSLAIELARYLPVEIINVDSALIYRELNIGSAKPSAIELQAVPHHLIDIISPLDNYSVASFLSDADRLIKDIHSRGKLPILVGGTMMYYNALLHGLSEIPESSSDVKAQISSQIEQLGRAAVYDNLKSVDPLAATKINPNDTQRLIRALEVYTMTGKPFSSYLNSRTSILNSYQVLSFALFPEDRVKLHERIAKRTDLMLQNCFIEEVQALMNNYPQLTSGHNSMRSVGYKEVWHYIEQGKNISLSELAELISASTRQLAKRQITWLRSMEQNINLNCDDYNQERLLKDILYQIEAK